MARAVQLVRQGFELGGAVSLLATIGAAGIVATMVGFVAQFPLPLRILAVISALLLVSAACLAAQGAYRSRRNLAEPEALMADHPPATPHVEQYVTDNTVSGDLNVIGILNIHAPQPEVGVHEEFLNRKLPDGRYLTRLRVHVTAAYAVENLYIRAEAASMARMGVSDAGTLGPRRETPNPAEPGVVFTVILKPQASYVADLVTTRPDNIAVVCLMNAEPHPFQPGDMLGGIGF